MTQLTGSQQHTSRVSTNTSDNGTCDCISNLVTSFLVAQDAFGKQLLSLQFHIGGMESLNEPHGKAALAGRRNWGFVGSLLCVFQN